jgi:hypothetical protein
MTAVKVLPLLHGCFLHDILCVFRRVLEAMDPGQREQLVQPGLIHLLPTDVQVICCVPLVHARAAKTPL